MTNEKSCKPEHSINNRVIALLVATLASFFTPFMASAVNIAIPSIGSSFGADVILLSWIPTAYLLAAAVFAVPFGRIADIHGMKKIFTYGIIIFTVASFLCAIAPSIISLIVFRIMQGVGSAMIFVTGLAIISSVYPRNERGKAIGINVASVYIGLSMGPVLGGLLTQYFGWRSIFLVVIPLGLLVIALTLTKLKGEWAECAGESFDIPGSVIYSVALVVLIYGFSILPGLYGILMVVAGVVGLLIFAAFELRVKNPVFEVRLFKNRTFGFSSLAALINYSSTFAVIFLLSLYLQYIKGMDPQAAGIILVAQPVVMAITSPIAGRLSDKFSPGSIATIGMAITTLSLICFTFLSSSTSIEYIVVVLLVLGFGLGLFSSPNTNAIMGSVEKKFYGIASATVGTMRLIGQMLSMGIAMLVFSIFIGNVVIEPSNYPALISSVNTVFMICAGLCFVGIFASYIRK
ncbi:drug resistance transporter, EmrB/QacA subfamily [Methanobacterium lacus]|uniref:Drug resistance transporter, EmrB/QacA subfamily n=1 Tax=Methanobacterium lacus (strain AL-21) TaxID=877455 RepID=F0T9P6_METLA|nr:MFS transporter [Methanobacterium lacus]ADZ09925.1 drug resistance transporter, EmrB/QacA subfamily [Methanobacterium lacus]